VRAVVAFAPLSHEVGEGVGERVIARETALAYTLSPALSHFMGEGAFKDLPTCL